MSICPSVLAEGTGTYVHSLSNVKDSSVVAVQIFDQRKFKRRDQGFLGVVNIRVSEVLDFSMGGHGMFVLRSLSPAHTFLFIRDAHPRLEKIK